MNIYHNPIFLLFISYAIGATLTVLLLVKLKITWFNDRNYISDKLTKTIGVLVMGWLVKNTFMKVFNQKIKLKSSATIEDLKTVKQEMTYSEVGHLIGFIVLLVLNILFIFWKMDWLYIIFFFLMNVFFNLHLVFLQQYNKRRLDRVIGDN